MNPRIQFARTAADLVPLTVDLPAEPEAPVPGLRPTERVRSEEHTSELQSH